MNENFKKFAENTSVLKTEKSKNEIIKNIVTSFLERRNYVEPSFGQEKLVHTLSSEQMAVAFFADKATARVNSILYTSINNEPKQVMQQYLKWLNWLCNIKSWKIQKELWFLARPLLCHLHLETLKGHNPDHTLKTNQDQILRNGQQDSPQIQCLVRLRHEYYEKLHKAHLNDNVPEKNKSEIKFNDISETVLDTLQKISTIQDIESYPIVMTFRSCKFRIELTTQAIKILINYLTKHGHVILLQVLQTWFDIDIIPEDYSSVNDSEDTEDEQREHELEFETDNNINSIEYLKNIEHNVYDSILLKDLESSIENLECYNQPILLYSLQNTQNQRAVTCGVADNKLKFIAMGFDNSEIRVWRKSCLPLMIPENNYSNIILACTDQLDNEIEQDNFKQLVFRGHCGRIHGIQFLTKSPYLFSVSYDCTMRAWDINENKCKAIYSGHNYPIWCIEVYDNLMYIATGSQDRTVRLWNPELIYPLRVFVGHTLDVNCIKFHPNGLYIASGSADRTIRFWQVTDASLARLIPVSRPVSALDFCPDGQYLASAGDDKSISIWNLAMGNRLTELRGHNESIGILRWLPNGTIISASLDGDIKIWNDPRKQASDSTETIQPFYEINTNCTYFLNIQYLCDQIICLGVKPYCNQD